MDQTAGQLSQAVRLSAEKITQDIKLMEGSVSTSYIRNI
jgi:hypothetical protein